ncbi:hypothetical protein H257_10258 [Aphanomyces astaci]|uniref:RBR-type E3 ubiquitin transferase n=1 Tax=Aphanomyces astaci TaxID=112090 RepID=W4G7Y9_APHAT|nr:hypothetical protein H257_10258 [Aphanomyces astaci]ETV75411.1 hypothetical protein H257_10258 [Aphanomyces astaci]|eukprot:XP_009835045.1 hypothetical protein H257_10258 [Aphanomyces astaci]
MHPHKQQPASAATLLVGPAATVPDGVALPSEASVAPVARRCAICLDDLDGAMAGGNNQTSETYTCGFCSTTVCDDCMLQYMHMTIVNEGRRRRWTGAKFTCPGPHCTATLSPDNVLQHTTADDYQLFVDLVQPPATKNHQSRIECPRCHSQDSVVSRRKVFCSDCNLTFCKTCGDVYHHFGCHKDKSFQAWTQHHDVRSCPQCHAAIEKTGGCTHMTCIYCEFDFCWLCRVEWQHHTDVMCTPRAFLTSSSTALGPTAPVRAVTKAVVVVAALAVVAVGVGVAAILVAPPMLFADSAKTWWRRKKQGKSLKTLKERHLKQDQPPP